MPLVGKGTPHIDEYLFEGPYPPWKMDRLRERGYETTMTMTLW